MSSQNVCSYEPCCAPVFAPAPCGRSGSATSISHTATAPRTPAPQRFYRPHAPLKTHRLNLNTGDFIDVPQGNFLYPTSIILPNYRIKKFA